MAEVRSFKAVYYNTSVVSNLSDTICPPYDIINPQLEEELYQRSQYNFVRIEHNRQFPQDSYIDNRYTRSAAKLKQWFEQKVLITDKTPAIYVHDHYFSNQDKNYRRRGLIVRVKIEEWHKNIIRPHEGTLTKAKSDRINLLESIKANTSPVMTLFEDKEKHISFLLKSQETNKYLINMEENNGERHKIWQITKPSVINEICASFKDKALYIADGHHRYESAMTYQRQLLAGSRAESKDADFNFVMMTMVDFDDPGLVILPPHRLLRGMTELKITGLGEKLSSFFDIAYLPLNLPDIWQNVDKLSDENKGVKLIIFGIDKQNLLLLTLRDALSANRMIPYFHSEIYKNLDVSIVDHVILEELLGLSSEDEVKISYNYDRRSAIQEVLDQEYQLVFIVKPVRAKTIKEIADVGDRMPRKSTYFYPKLPSGLIINRLL